MSAYYAPAFFGHLLGKCLKRRNPFLEVSKLGLVVLGTCAIVWWPYLHSADAIFRVSNAVHSCFFHVPATGSEISNLVLYQVVSRLAPFERGIYEDYVANFWCATSILIKWKRLFMTQSLKLLSLTATVSTFLPSMIQQIRAPSGRGFLYSMLNTSLSFYLFSFQGQKYVRPLFLFSIYSLSFKWEYDHLIYLECTVHEKSILLPILPASLMAREEPFLYEWLTHFALLSMFPLLCRDGLILPYIVLYALFFLLFYAPQGSKDSPLGVGHSSTAFRYLTGAALLCSFSIHVIYLALAPTEKYPFLFEALMMILCFFQFSLLAIYSNWKQWRLSEDLARSRKEKKLLWPVSCCFDVYYLLFCFMY